MDRLIAAAIYPLEGGVSYDAVDSQEYELFKMESKRLLTKESLLELLQEFNEQTASLATVLMEMGKLV